MNRLRKGPFPFKKLINYRRIRNEGIIGDSRLTGVEESLQIDFDAKTCFQYLYEENGEQKRK